MHYSEAREKIRSGDLLAWRGKGLVSWLIRHVTGGSHTHVGVAWWLHDRLFILEAREGVGVQIRAASAALPFDWISLDLIWDEVTERFALQALGKPYSYADALRAGLGFRLSDDGYICSEYAAEVIRCLEMDCSDRPASHSTPTGLVQHWLDHGKALGTVSR